MNELKKQVRRVQFRLAFQRFLGSLGWCLFATLLAALALALVGRYRPLGLEDRMLAAVAVGLGVLAAVTWTIVRRGGSLEAAIEFDRRFGLRERVSSTLAMSDRQRQSDVGQALVHDATRRVERVHVGEQFRVRPGYQLLLPLAPGIAVLLVAMLIDPAVIDKTANADTDARQQVTQSAESLKRKLVEQRKKAQEEGLKDLEQFFSRLEEATGELTNQPEGDRKKALVRLNDLERQMNERRRQLGGGNDIQKQLDRLKKADQGPAEKFRNALANGNLNQAMQELRNLKSKLDRRQLTDQEREQLANQFDNMKKKLEEMVQEHEQATQNLKNQIQQARQAGQDQLADNLQRQLNEMRQQQAQMDQLQDLANQLGQCAQCLNDGQLQDAGDLLDQLQGNLGNLQQQLQELELLDGAVNDLCQARNQMNCDQCGGQGCGACQGDKPGQGLGEGQGMGPRPEEETDYRVFDTKVPQQIGPGAATIEGPAGGPNIAGAVLQRVQDQDQSATSEASDPLTGQQLPRRQREHATEYFDRFREGE